MSNIWNLYLSPYTVASIRHGGVLLTHLLNDKEVLIRPKSGQLRQLWERMNQGGNEAFWRKTLQLAENCDSNDLEFFIQKGYLE